MELPCLAKDSTASFVPPVPRLWFTVMGPSKGCRLVTLVGPLTFLGLGLLWPPSVLCGPVSHRNADPLVQLIEVLEILFYRGVYLSVLRFL